MVAETPTDRSEFIFIDESGEPGSRGNRIYIVTGVHVPDASQKELRQHLTAFRYHHDVTKELKVTGALLKDKFTPPMRALIGFLAELADAGEVTATTNWIDKENYSGPHMEEGKTTEFRHFQLRMLLERHKSRRPWGSNVDIVLDRWSMSDEQKANIETYIKGNWNLQPIRHMTFVDSTYTDLVQIADLYTKLARRVVEGEADDEQMEMCGRLMSLKQYTRGLY
jgi:hypothetical protein